MINGKIIKTGHLELVEQLENEGYEALSASN
jgi:Fe-S cluster assembly ATPase SufC